MVLETKVVHLYWVTHNIWDGEGMNIELNINPRTCSALDKLALDGTMCVCELSGTSNNGPVTWAYGYESRLRKPILGTIYATPMLDLMYHYLHKKEIPDISHERVSILYVPCVLEDYGDIIEPASIGYRSLHLHALPTSDDGGAGCRCVDYSPVIHDYQAKLSVLFRGRRDRLVLFIESVQVQTQVGLVLAIDGTR
jgi:hypothetical protein